MIFQCWRISSKVFYDASSDVNKQAQVNSLFIQWWLIASPLFAVGEQCGSNQGHLPQSFWMISYQNLIHIFEKANQNFVTCTQCVNLCIRTVYQNNEVCSKCCKRKNIDGLLSCSTVLARDRKCVLLTSEYQCQQKSFSCVGKLLILVFFYYSWVCVSVLLRADRHIGLGRLEIGRKSLSHLIYLQMSICVNRTFCTLFPLKYFWDWMSNQNTSHWIIWKNRCDYCDFFPCLLKKSMQIIIIKNTKINETISGKMSVESEGNGMKTICACDSRLIGWLIYALFAYIWFQFQTNTQWTHRHTHKHGQLSIIVNAHQHTIRAVYTQSHSTHTDTNTWKCIVRYSYTRREKKKQKQPDTNTERKQQQRQQHSTSIGSNAYKNTLCEWSAIHFSIEIQCIQIGKFYSSSEERK